MYRSVLPLIFSMVCTADSPSWENIGDLPYLSKLRNKKRPGDFFPNGLEVERDISELLAQVPFPLGRFSVIFIIGNLVSLSRVNLVGNGPKRGNRNLKINA